MIVLPFGAPTYISVVNLQSGIQKRLLMFCLCLSLVLCFCSTKTLFEDRFKGLDAQCADDLFKLLVPCEDRLPQCYESLFTYNYTCPDLHGCNSRVPDPEKSARY